MAERKNYHLEAMNLIKTYTMYSWSTGLIPLPGIDVLTNTGIQMELTRQLCDLYFIKYESARLRSLTHALVGSTLARVGALGTRSLLKLIPGAGSLVGVMVMGTYAAASTYASGIVFKKHIEKGGTLEDFDVVKMQKLYEEQLIEARELIRQWQEKK